MILATSKENIGCFFYFVLPFPVLSRFLGFWLTFADSIFFPHPRAVAGVALTPPTPSFPQVFPPCCVPSLRDPLSRRPFQLLRTPSKWPTWSLSSLLASCFLSRLFPLGLTPPLSPSCVSPSPPNSAFLLPSGIHILTPALPPLHQLPFPSHQYAPHTSLSTSMFAE